MIKLWFIKYNKVFIFHDAVFATYSENDITKMWQVLFFMNRQTKTTLFLLLLKTISISVSIFYENSFVFDASACELSLQKILFSSINCSLFCFFLFFFFFIIKFLARICIQKLCIFSGLVLLIIWMFSVSLLRKLVVHMCLSLILIKITVRGQQFYQKRDSDTGIFLWMLQNVLRALPLKNTFW